MSSRCLKLPTYLMFLVCGLLLSDVALASSTNKHSSQNTNAGEACSLVIEAKVVKAQSRGPQKVDVTAKNLCNYAVALLTLDLVVLGGKVNLQFENIASKGKAMKSLLVPTIRELGFEHPVVIDAEANRRSPNLDIRIRKS